MRKDEIMKELFKALCAVEPEKSKNEKIDDPVTQEMLKFFADFILSRETAMNEKIVELQEEIERLKFWIPKQDRAY